MTLKIGSLFSGYGGLDLAVQQVYDAEPVWHVEFDAAPSKILAHHWPRVPNLHDVTAVDWEQVDPIDILTGGFPCQDVSVAGRRAGMTDGTRSGLWSHMAHAIDVLRPPLVVIENVGGLFSAEATRVMEPHPLCLGDGGTGVDTVLLRAVDAVLSTLSELGYDAEWTALRASDVGAPHGRLRVFITAHPQGEPWSVEHGGGRAAADTCGGGSGGRTPLPVTGGARGSDAPAVGTDPRPGAPGSAPGLNLLPTPAAARAGRQRSASEGAAIRPTLDSIHQLLPTPTVQDGANTGGPSQHRRNTPPLNAIGGLLPTPSAVRAGRQKSASAGAAIRPTLDSIHQLIPTPSVADAMGGHERRGGARGDELLLKGLAKEGRLERFGPYGLVIERWEQVLGRPAPDPTEPGKNRPRLSARFVEWLMGLPDGHVTDTPSLTRNQQLKALGNGVVPQQGAAALAHLDHIRRTA